MVGGQTCMNQETLTFSNWKTSKNLTPGSTSARSIRGHPSRSEGHWTLLVGTRFHSCFAFLSHLFPVQKWHSGDDLSKRYTTPTSYTSKSFHCFHCNTFNHSHTFIKIFFLFFSIFPKELIFLFLDTCLCFDFYCVIKQFAFYSPRKKHGSFFETRLWKHNSC